MSTKLLGWMSPPSPELQTSGPEPTAWNGPSGLVDVAAPMHIRPLAVCGAVKYIRYTPSARRETSGAQKAPVPAHAGLAGSASPRTVHGPVADGALAIGVRPAQLLVE